MRRYQGLGDLTPEQFRHPVIFTLGVFDGVHRGHRRLLDALRAEADERAGEAVLLTFDRHPREVLSATPPPSLTSLERRLELFEESGIDVVILLPFTPERARTTAEEFLAEVMVRVRPERLLIGANHHFGRGREGDYEFVAARAGRYGYEAREIRLETDGETISSTRIRAAVLAGELDEAAAMLGRPVAVCGRVIDGDKRGRTIGFPTANLELEQSVRPPRGVYAARTTVDGLDGTWLTLVNIGRRPTFHDDQPDLVEAHLLEFSGDLYGRRLRLDFLSRIRDEQSFAGIEELKAQIARDRATALARHGEAS